jgi:hypothetical protein
VVTKCCEVKETKEVKEHMAKDGKDHKDGKDRDGVTTEAEKGSAAVTGSGQASVNEQSATVTQSQTVGAVTVTATLGIAGAKVNFDDQDAMVIQKNSVDNTQTGDITITKTVTVTEDSYNKFSYNEIELED